MKTTKIIKTGLLPFMLIVFCSGFFIKSDLYGQQDKVKKNQPDVKVDVRREYDEHGNIKSYDSTYSYSWSSKGDEKNIDSVLRSLNRNFGFSPFGFDEPFHMPYGNIPDFPSNRAFRNLSPGDSLDEYINPDDSVYYFDNPNLFKDPFNNEFFNDPFFGNNFHLFPGLKPHLYAPSDSMFDFDFQFDMRSMLEEQKRMMEHMHQFFDFDGHDYPILPDTVPSVPKKQNNSAPLFDVPKGQEI